jgi:hypothetical protein
MVVLDLYRNDTSEFESEISNANPISNSGHDDFDKVLISSKLIIYSSIKVPLVIGIDFWNTLTIKQSSLFNLK